MEADFFGLADKQVPLPTEETASNDEAVNIQEEVFPAESPEETMLETETSTTEPIPITPFSTNTPEAFQSEEQIEETQQSYAAQSLASVPDEEVAEELPLSAENVERAPSWLFSLLTETLLAPVAQFKGYCQEVYWHYKKQNKLPVFFMTVGGVLTLLFGFGYWMREEANTFYFELTKTIVGFVAASGAIWWGKRLLRNHERYDEFGSALFGLGISLNYLMLYFLADAAVFPFFSNTAVGLLMVLLNTLLATWLALRYRDQGSGSCKPVRWRLLPLSILIVG